MVDIVDTAGIYVIYPGCIWELYLIWGCPSIEESVVTRGNTDSLTDRQRHAYRQKKRCGLEVCIIHKYHINSVPGPGVW